ncbi:phosphoesterase [Aquimarina litoralis]|uniref:phosphoesterase n=1 Tax=Aquimarina litoralis TaxID=584605 RepID=UPI001C55CFEF|nr:phosphoesterase [Aquimarina litoralis]MBW1293960.1 phosphoesterase [Aquimarina litoralis]
MAKNVYSVGIALITLLILNGCATFKAQYENSGVNDTKSNSEIEHSFYLIGNTGNLPIDKPSETLVSFKKELNKASENSTAIFLGDNIYENGMPENDHPNRRFAEGQLNFQTDVVEGFKGKTVFIPGNRDWNNDGLEGLKRQEKYINEKVGKHTFLPKNGCPIENIHISDDIELILIDSYWYITNWDKYPTLNDDCDIKTRTNFFDEYMSLIKKSRGKTTIVALHHPMYSNGSHGGQYTFGSHMIPFPILGTLKNVIRRTSGVANVDLQNKRYNEFKRRLVTISQENKKVVFVSGHEHNLQYIVEDNLHQIISGSGSGDKISATRNIGGAQFSYGTYGYAKLDIYKDGSSYVQFYTTENEKIVFNTRLFSPNPQKKVVDYPNNFPKEKMASIYTKKETDKSGFYRFLWGDRYRRYYSTEVSAPTVNLDTLYGGLTVVKKGGGNQSKSLRLQDKNGAQYVMRALRKNAVQYLQAVMFKDQYIEGQFDHTGTENLIMDVFAGSYPYAPFAIGTLSDAVGVYHTNPILYYIPKQNALGEFNKEFGDELYMIEEHASAGHGNLESFGFQDKIISTRDVMKKIHKDEDIVIDEASYIRARLFDMLIGDWDRHQDQWRWIEFNKDGKIVYRPLPRDRDQAFSIMSDGFLLGAAVTLVPTTRALRKYDDDLKDVKGVNVAPYPLDMEFIELSDKDVWDKQVKMIQEGITDAIIDKAFLSFPKEVQDETVDEIKKKLKARRANLQAISNRYYTLLNRFSVIKGTNKDDYFTIDCFPDGKVKILGQRIKEGKKADVFHERLYSKEFTKEIWIYGLDDDDVFEVKGKSKKIKIRLIGGQNNDTYLIPDGNKIVVYDHKSKPNDITKAKTAKIRLRDDYETNTYDYKKLKNNINQLIPTLGSNPDDGFKIGVSNTYTPYGFERNPFTSNHTVSASYYFATQGFDLNYNGEFANVIGNLNIGIDAHFNSPNFAVNFFGFGNSTPNFEANDSDGIDVDLDYNRVKIRTLSAMPSIIWRGELGGHLKIGAFYESNEVERTNGRFLDDVTDVNTTANLTPINNDVFDKQDFYGIDAAYYFENKDNPAFPTLGMQIGLQLGYKNNVSTGKGFGYIMPELGFDYKLIPSGQLVLATDLRAHINIGDDFEFYQGASLGANNGLRGYRNQRFTGKSAFVQSTDIRWNFLSLKTALLPISLGIYAGADYGRVWIDDELAFDQSFNENDLNTSFGGGAFVSLANMLTANISTFKSDDGLRFAFQLGFGF